MGRQLEHPPAPGTEAAGAAVSGGRIWLRVNADIRPGPDARPASPTAPTARPSRRSAGVHAQQRLAVLHGLPVRIFNYATRALGGAVTVKRFDLTTP
jgi:hypothetical protein